MTKMFLTVLIITLWSSTSFAKICKKGKPCGNSCISWTKTCHVDNVYRPVERSSQEEKVKPTSNVKISSKEEIRGCVFKRTVRTYYTTRGSLPRDYTGALEDLKGKSSEEGANHMVLRSTAETSGECKTCITLTADTYSCFTGK